MAAPRASRRPRASNTAVPAYRRRLPGPGGVDRQGPAGHDQLLAPIHRPEDLHLQRPGIGRPRDRPAAGTIERRPHELRAQVAGLVEERRVRSRPPGDVDGRRRGHGDRQIRRGRAGDRPFVVGQHRVPLTDPHDERPVKRHAGRPHDLNTTRARPSPHIRPPEPPPDHDRPLSHESPCYPTGPPIHSRRASPGAEARRERRDQG